MTWLIGQSNLKPEFFTSNISLGSDFVVKFETSFDQNMMLGKIFSLCWIFWTCEKEFFSVVILAAKGIFNSRRQWGYFRFFYLTSFWFDKIFFSLVGCLHYPVVMHGAHILTQQTHQHPSHTPTHTHKHAHTQIFYFCFPLISISVSVYLTSALWHNRRQK